jgi:hypothetical protein
MSNMQVLKSSHGIPGLIQSLPTIFNGYGIWLDDCFPEIHWPKSNSQILDGKLMRRFVFGLDRRLAPFSAVDDQKHLVRQLPKAIGEAFKASVISRRVCGFVRPPRAPVF